MKASLLLQALLAAGLLACASAPRLKPTARIDHLVIGVADLAAALEQIAALTGVKPVIGGEHPGRGTHNALLALGDGAYLELIAARPGAEGPDLAEMRALPGPTPIAWAVAFDDFDVVASAIREAGFAASALEPGSRRTPSGGLLEWETFGLEPELAGAPFFIRWLPGTAHPSATSPAGCTLRRLEIAVPEVAGLTRLRDALQLPVEIVASAVPAYRVALQCPQGPLSLPAND